MITRIIRDDFYLKEWYDFERYQPRDKLNLLESVYNRINKFIGHERIRRIVGQQKSTVNFREAMDEGKIILVNLAPRKFSPEIKNMLGVMIIDMIVEAATSRNNIPEHKSVETHLRTSFTIPIPSNEGVGATAPELLSL